MEVSIRLNGERAAWAEDNLQRLVVVDGAAVSGDSARLTVAEGPARLAEIPSRAQIRFAADGSQLGAVLKVAALGWNDRLGTIDIRAEPLDADAALHEPRDADWTGQTLGSIAARIADRSSLTAAVASALRGVEPGEAIQIGESDQAFLGRIAADAGGELAVKDGHVIIVAAGEALSAGSALPLAPVEIDTDSGDWLITGASRPPQFASVSARWRSPDGTSGVSTAGSGTPVRRLPGLHASAAAARAAARRALVTTQAEEIELNLTGPINPHIRPFHPLRLTGARASLVRGRELRIGDTTHAVSAFGAPTTVFRAFSTPQNGG